LGFALKACAKNLLFLGINVQRLFANDLNSRWARQQCVAGKPYVSHSAGTELAYQRITAELGTFVKQLGGNVQLRIVRQRLLAGLIQPGTEQAALRGSGICHIDMIKGRQVVIGSKRHACVLRKQTRIVMRAWSHSSRHWSIPEAGVVLAKYGSVRRREFDESQAGMHASDTFG
jgi:hypothetical protein